MPTELIASPRVLVAADVMTRDPVTIAARARVSEALETMEREGVRHLPVVQDGRLVGLLSERHVRDAAPSILTVTDAGARHRCLVAARVDQIAIPHPRTVASTTPLPEVIDALRELRAGSLPVVDDGALVGIVSTGDLLDLLERLLQG